MGWTLRDANLHSPRTIMNDIVHDLRQMDDEGRLVVNDVFPLVELSDSKETHFTRNGLRHSMQRTALGSESPIADIEDMGEKDVEVYTFKEKIKADKGVNTELNSQSEILNLYNEIRGALREDIVMTRAQVAWQGGRGGDIDGLIGVDGTSAHGGLASSHVRTPSTPYSDHGAAEPITDFLESEQLINEDGGDLSQTGPITAHMSPSTLTDLKLNNDIQSEYENTRALSQQQLADALQVDTIRTIRTVMPRRDADGNLVDENGNVVSDPEDAAADNILEPHDGASNNRNIVIMPPGQETAFMPWFADRLAERAAGVDPTGDFAVDMTNGFMTQTWTQPDPALSWFKAAQEIGLHVRRPGNIVVIQDI